MRKVFSTLLLTLTTGLLCNAQLYTTGEDPAGVKWSTRHSADVRIVYPQACDSLSVQYLKALETYRPQVGASIGVMPNQRYRRGMPTVLHPYYPVSNGSVSWAPRIMNLNTTADPYAPDPYPWIDQLAIHESRHVSQMQVGRRGVFKYLTFIAGDLSTGAAAALYGGPAFFEGDAVTTETALTRSGRGRTADFMEYYRAAFAQGDFRNYYKWRYGSQNQFTPDHYRVGYMTVAGVRTTYDDPLFAKRFYDNVAKFSFNVLHKTVRQASGLKFKKAFKQIESDWAEQWQSDRVSREASTGGFVEGSQLTPTPRLYEDYTSLVMTPQGLYASRKGIAQARELVRIDSCGRAHHETYRGSQAGDMQYDSGRLYWSEFTPDIRWGMGGTSRIRYYDLDSHKQVDLTSSGRLYNPCPDGEVVYAVDYPIEGGSAVVKISSSTGEELSRWTAPGELQVVEVAICDKGLIASAISSEGFGLYLVEDYTPVLQSQPVKIKQLRGTPDGVLFVSDRTGVNELYRWNGECLVQLSSSAQGSADWAFDEHSAYCSSLTRDSRDIRKMPLDSLKSLSVDFSDIHHYAVADELSVQEDSLSKGPQWSGEYSGAQHYSKLGHLFRLHSWLPLYVDYEAIESMSGESITSAAGLGATLLLQNDLSTMYGSLYYSYDINNGANKFGARFTYSGLYPVLEGRIEYGERGTYLYDIRQFEYNGKLRSAGVYATPLSAKLLRGEIKAYVPLNFSKGGWSRGVIPQVSLSLSNDIFDKSLLKFNDYYTITGEGLEYLTHGYVGAEVGSRVWLGTYKASVRGYTVLTTPSSCIYPRWGVGAEVGIAGYNSLSSIYTPCAYMYLYGYVPGIMRTHGIKLTATNQSQLGRKSIFNDNRFNTLPRGLSSSILESRYMQTTYSNQLRLTIDYALPFAPLGVALGQLAYIRNLELIPHADLTLGYGGGPCGTLYSVGASLSAHLGNLAWVPYDTRIGVTCSYNGGSAFLPDSGVKRFYIGMVFSVDM